MTDTEQGKPPSGTAWIISGVVLGGIGLVHLVTAPMVIAAAEGDMPTVSGKIFGVLLFLGLGAWLFITGMNKRHRYNAWSISRQPS